MVNRVERNELESYTQSARDAAPGRGGGTPFWNPGGGTPKRGGSKPTAPARPPGVGAAQLSPADTPSSLRPGAPIASRGLARGRGTAGSVGSARRPPPRLPAPPKKVQTAPFPLISPRTFPTDAAQRREPGRGPARRGPGGPRATKARPAASAPRLPFQFSPDLRWN